MKRISESTPNIRFLDIATLERKAELQYQQGQFEDAVLSIQEIIDKLDENDAGWYIQLMATYLYPADTNASMKKQKDAFLKNNHLYRPEQGIVYNRLTNNINGREEIILEWIRKYKDPTNLIIALMNILDDVSFGLNSDQFENGIKEIGNMLGFNSQRPEKESGKGPDNLWNIESKQFWLISCKNKVKTDRHHIHKKEVNQLSGDINWFKQHYDGCTAIPIFIHPSKTLSSDAYINNDAYVIREENLNLLKENIRKFYKFLVKHDLTDISKEMIKAKLSENHLSTFDIRSQYMEKIEQSPNS